MFTNITENCIVSPSGSSPSSAVVGDWHTYDNCWRVRAARSAARVKVGPGPLLRAFSHKPRSRRSPFLRSSPFCSVPCCVVCVPYWITRAAVRRLTHVCRLWWLTTARHGTVRYPRLSWYDLSRRSRGSITLCNLALSVSPQRNVSFGERTLVGKPFQCPGLKTPEIIGTESSKITLPDLIIDPGVYFQTLDGTCIRDLKRVSVFTFKSWPVCFKTPLLLLLK